MSAKRNTKTPAPRSTAPSVGKSINSGPSPAEAEAASSQPALGEEAPSGAANEPVAADAATAGPETAAISGNAGASDRAVSASASPAAAAPEAAIIVFGLYEGAPQGSWFPAAEAELATKAAGMMGLRVVEVVSDDHRALAKELRHGQVFAADRMFAPAIRRDLYERLHALTEAKIPARGVPHRPEPSTRWASARSCS